MKKKRTKTSSGRVETPEGHRTGLKSLWVGQTCVLNLECENEVFGLKDLNFLMCLIYVCTCGGVTCCAFDGLH